MAHAKVIKNLGMKSYFSQSFNAEIWLDTTKRRELNWPTRFEIIRGIARGMVYLHVDSPMRTIHRELKAGNVLLDSEMSPKIADFGMRIFSFDQTHIDTSRVVGTYGYMAPEYLLQGQFSVKSDVYSFGVLVLEIINGRRISAGATTHHSGTTTVNLMSFGEDNPLALMDPMLKDSFSSDELIKCVHLGLLCVQEDISTTLNNHHHYENLRWLWWVKGGDLGRYYRGRMRIMAWIDEVLVVVLRLANIGTSGTVVTLWWWWRMILVVAIKCEGDSVKWVFKPSKFG
ncbi:hypothetical protein KSS87_002443 [Heliosperma pusillum]|nr:hypothetical protein KSS87_002443 [Heliosperma pusillum]